MAVRLLSRQHRGLGHQPVRLIVDQKADPCEPLHISFLPVPSRPRSGRRMGERLLHLISEGVRAAYVQYLNVRPAAESQVRSLAGLRPPRRCPRNCEAENLRSRCRRRSKATSTADRLKGGRSGLWCCISRERDGESSSNCGIVSQPPSAQIRPSYMEGAQAL
jgi:hypothetical protein